MIRKSTSEDPGREMVDLQKPSLSVSKSILSSWEAARGGGKCLPEALRKAIRFFGDFWIGKELNFESQGHPFWYPLEFISKLKNVTEKSMDRKSKKGAQDRSQEAPRMNSPPPLGPRGGVWGGVNPSPGIGNFFDLIFYHSKPPGPEGWWD